jgi:hypothetical protein
MRIRMRTFRDRAHFRTDHVSFAVTISYTFGAFMMIPSNLQDRILIPFLTRDHLLRTPVPDDGVIVIVRSDGDELSDPTERDCSYRACIRRQRPEALESSRSLSSIRTRPARRESRSMVPLAGQ